MAQGAPVFAARPLFRYEIAASINGPLPLAAARAHRENVVLIAAQAAGAPAPARRSRARCRACVRKRRAQLGSSFDEARGRSWSERCRSGDPSFDLSKAAWAVGKKSVQAALDERARVDAEPVQTARRGCGKSGGKGDLRRGGKSGWRGGKGLAESGKGKGASKSEPKGAGKKRPRDEGDRDDRQPRTPKRA